MVFAHSFLFSHNNPNIHSSKPEEVLSDIISCPICGVSHTDLYLLGKKSLRHEWDEKFKLAWLRCSKCLHSFVWPFLSPQNLSDIYSTSYSNQAGFSSAVLRGESQFKLLQQLQLISSRVGPSPERYILKKTKNHFGHNSFIF